MAGHRAPQFDPQRGYRGRGPLKLPAEGRQGRTPRWPLPDAPSSDERKAWRQLWATPQAVAWERLGWTRTIARYCRMMIEAERAGAGAALLTAVAGLEDRIGLTPKAMRMLLWEIVRDEVEEQRQEPVSVRDRIKAV